MKVIREYEKHLNFILTLIATFVLAFGIVLTYDIYYDMNDDLLIKDILSGSYTGMPSPFSIQMLFPISWVISMFYRILPSLPWYGFFLSGSFLFCFFLVGKRIVTFVNPIWKKISLLAIESILLLGLMIYDLVYIQYTVSCGILVATGTFLFATSNQNLPTKKFLKQNIISIVLVVIGFYVRTEMALLLFPFIGAVGIMKWYDGVSKQHKKEQKKECHLKYIIIIATILLGMAFGLFVDKVACSSKQWKDFRNLFDSRTELYDFYRIWDYEFDEHRQLYTNAGISRTQQSLLVNYNYIFDDSLDAQHFQRLEQQIKENGVPYFMLSTIEGFREYKYRLLHKVDAPFIYIIWIGYVSLILLAIINKNWSFAWRLPLLGICRTVSWMYIIMRGRTPERITHPLLIVEIGILMAMMLVDVRSSEQKEKVLYRRFLPITTIAMICVVAIGAMGYYAPKVKAEQIRREVMNEEWKQLIDYCNNNPNNLYLIDCYSTVNYSEKMFIDINNSLDNFHYAGGWACKSPLEDKKLKQFDVDNIQKDIYEKDHIYFVSYVGKDTEWIREFYAMKGIAVVIDKIDYIPFQNNNGFQIYKIKRPLRKGKVL